MIEILGVAEVIARFVVLEREVTTGAASAVQAALDAAKSTADSITPVRTGYMLSRNQTRMTGPTEGEFFNDALYAIFVARGHHTRSGSWVAPQDFMTPAFVVGRSVLMAQLAQLI